MLLTVVGILFSPDGMGIVYAEIPWLSTVALMFGNLTPVGIVPLAVVGILVGTLSFHAEYIKQVIGNMSTNNTTLLDIRKNVQFHPFI